MPVTISAKIQSDALDAQRGLPHVQAALPRILARASFEIAKRIEKTAKDSLFEPKSGRDYRVTKSGKKHRASAPGEPPASNTGDMLGSIHSEPELVGSSAITGSVLAHPSILELKGPGGNRELRPWLAPAVEKHEPAIEALILRELEQL